MALCRRDTGRSRGEPQRLTIGIRLAVGAKIVDEKPCTEVATACRAKACTDGGVVTRGQPWIQRRAETVRALVTGADSMGLAATLSRLALAHAGAALLRALAGCAHVEATKGIRLRLFRPVFELVTFLHSCRLPRSGAEPETAGGQQAKHPATRWCAAQRSRQGRNSLPIHGHSPQYWPQSTRSGRAFVPAGGNTRIGPQAQGAALLTPTLSVCFWFRSCRVVPFQIER
jgi:hypothetical protein